MYFRCIYKQIDKLFQYRTEFSVIAKHIATNITKRSQYCLIYQNFLIRCILAILQKCQFFQNLVFNKLCKKIIILEIYDHLFRKRPYRIAFLEKTHRVKTFLILSFSGPYFPTLGLITEIYSVNFHIQSKFGKIRTRKTPNMDTFQAVIISKIVESEGSDVEIL